MRTFNRTIPCVSSEACPAGCTSMEVHLKLILHAHPKSHAKKESARSNKATARAKNNKKCKEKLLLFADWNSNKMTVQEESRHYFLSRSASSGKSLRQEAKQFFIQLRNETRAAAGGVGRASVQRHERRRRDVEDGIRPDTIGMIVGVSVAIILLIIFFIILAICCNFFACYDRCFQKCGCNQCCPNCMSYYMSSACSCFDSQAARRARRKGQIVIETQQIPVPTMVEQQPVPVAHGCQNMIVENALVPMHSPPAYEMYEYSQPAMTFTSAVAPANQMVSSGGFVPAGQMVSSGGYVPANQMLSSGGFVPGGSAFSSGQLGQLVSGGQFVTDGQMFPGAATLSTYPSMQMSRPNLHAQ